MTYVMSDIHGQGERFDRMLKRIGFCDTDTLYILGDIADRGPDGIRLLRYVMDAPNIHMILGNHEHMLLEALNYPTGEQYIFRWYRNGGEVTHRALFKLPTEEISRIFEYLGALPLNLNIKVNGQDFILAHGAPVESFGIMPSKYTELTRFAVWARPTAPPSGAVPS